MRLDHLFYVLFVFHFFSKPLCFHYIKKGVMIWVEFGFGLLTDMDGF